MSDKLSDQAKRIAELFDSIPHHAAVNREAAYWGAIAVIAAELNKAGQAMVDSD